MSRELGRGELLVCQIVGASLLAMVSALILNKGIESVFDRPPIRLRVKMQRRFGKQEVRPGPILST
jgi:hypothetical protein